MTVLSAAVTAVLVVLGVACLWLMGAVRTAHQARAAADLAALAAAATAGLPDGDPCRAAVRVAEANAATLRSCDIGGDGSVTVAVSVPVRLSIPGVPDEARARARAGPRP
jgi:secretion/DNA translocation related TadE-like protein